MSTVSFPIFKGVTIMEGWASSAERLDTRRDGTTDPPSDEDTSSVFRKPRFVNSAAAGINSKSSAGYVWRFVESEI